MRGKYVIISSPYGEFPVLFSLGQEHKDFKRLNLVSAGEFSISLQHFLERPHKRMVINCFGESLGLGLEARPEDIGLLEAHFRMNDAEMWELE